MSSTIELMFLHPYKKKKLTEYHIKSLTMEFLYNTAASKQY